MIYLAAVVSLLFAAHLEIKGMEEQDSIGFIYPFHVEANDSVNVRQVKDIVNKKWLSMQRAKGFEFKGNQKAHGEELQKKFIFDEDAIAPIRAQLADSLGVSDETPYYAEINDFSIMLCKLHIARVFITDYLSEIIEECDDPTYQSRARIIFEILEKIEQIALHLTHTKVIILPLKKRKAHYKTIVLVCETSADCKNIKNLKNQINQKWFELLDREYFNIFGNIENIKSYCESKITFDVRLYDRVAMQKVKKRLCTADIVKFSDHINEIGQILSQFLHNKYSIRFFIDQNKIPKGLIIKKCVDDLEIFIITLLRHYLATNLKPLKTPSYRHKIINYLK